MIDPRPPYALRDSDEPGDSPTTYARDHVGGPAVERREIERPVVEGAALDGRARVVCATDLSPRAARAEQLAWELADGWGGKLDLVYVHEHAQEATDERALWAPTRARNQRRAAERELALVAGRLGPGVGAVFLEGDPRRLITNHAAMADLVVVGAPVRSRLRRFFAPGTVEHLVHTSRVPVLVVPLVDDTGSRDGT